MPPTSSLTDDQARAQALDAADRLFYERGIRPVRMEEIRDASGVSLKRLYRLFPTKEQLAEAALRRRDGEFLGSLLDHTAAAPTGRERVLGVFDYLEAWFAEPGFRGCAFINAFGEMGATTPCIEAAAQAQKRGLRDLIGELVDAAGGTRALAEQIAMLVNGATVSAAILGDGSAAASAKRAAAVLLDEQGL